MKSISRVLLIITLGMSLNLHAETGLIKAVLKRNLDNIKVRLSAGENINEPDKNGWTPLMWATYYQSFSIVEYLLEKGADPNIQSTRDSYCPKGTTALMIACNWCMYNEAVVLINKNAKPHFVNSKGYSATSYAREAKCDTILELLGRGVNRNNQQAGPNPLAPVIY